MKLLLRWSGRDLRARWLQVAAIALIIALGSGLYSGLSSTTRWRQMSYDRSFEQLQLHDLRVSLSAGTHLPATALSEAARAIPHAEWIRAAAPRLIVSTQVDASTRGETILVPGRIVGADPAEAGPPVDALVAKVGRVLDEKDTGTDRAVLDFHFAKHYGLAVDRPIVVSGNHSLAVVGQVLAPEYVVVTGDDGNLLGEANFAVVFASLETAQRLAGQPGMANDLAITLKSGADVGTIRRELSAAFGARFPGVGIKLLDRHDDRQFRLLYDNLDNDQRFFDIFAVLVLLAASFSAFNLTSRMVEAQRREIGIGMALGANPRRLAVRPFLAGLEIAVLGVISGVGFGLFIGWLMTSVMRDIMPLPTWHFPFQAGLFAQGAVLGIAMPMAATLFPIWRAVRVPPVAAIRSSALNRHGHVPILARIPVPGRTTTQLPVRNLLRSPRRTLLTAFGLAAAISVVIALVGMIDSLVATIDRVDAEMLKENPRRFNVTLDGFVPESAETVGDIAALPVVASASPTLQVGGTLSHGADRAPIDVMIQMLDLQTESATRGTAPGRASADGLWSPTVQDFHSPDGLPGIVITEKAAKDLAAPPGTIISLRHPRRSGLTSYEFVDSPVRIIGTNPIPMRFFAYMDRRDASLMGLKGITNSVAVTVDPDVSSGKATRTLFEMPGVGSVQPVDAFTESVREELGGILGILAIVEGTVLLLALLIAFNAASINADERARDHATMFAFGVRTRTVTRMAVIESMLVGLLATVLGVVFGWLLLNWLIGALLPESYPDLGIVASLSWTTVLSAVALGVVAAAAAPLLMIRKLLRMDIPSTLRVSD